jgi:hypothetical protein
MANYDNASVPNPYRDDSTAIVSEQNDPYPYNPTYPIKNIKNLLSTTLSDNIFSDSTQPDKIANH